MNPDQTILIVDDEPKILEVVADFLRGRGARVLTAEDGQNALEIVAREDPALVILDLMLPDLSGEDCCRLIRNLSEAPIIMLTAKAGEDDLLRGLNLGADDYLTKPFSLRELGARAEAVLRRAARNRPAAGAFSSGNLTMDFEKKLVRKQGRAVNLTPSEFKILAALIRRPGRVFSREELLAEARPEELDSCDRAVDSHIKNLRQKIEDRPKTPIYVLTVHGLGYKFGGSGHDPRP